MSRIEFSPPPAPAAAAVGRSTIRLHLLIGGIAVLIAGCNQAKDQVPVFAVAGTVTYNGQPMKGASIVLVPATPNAALRMPPFGRVEDDGTFAITTYGGSDGAPPGEYRVTFTWSDGDPDSPTDLLKGRFSDPRKPVTTVTITESSNQLPPIQLTGPKITPPN